MVTHFTSVQDGDKESRFDYLTLNFRNCRSSIKKSIHLFTLFVMYKRNNCKSFAESFLKIEKGKISTIIRTLCRMIIPVPMWVFLTGIRGSF